MGTVGIVGVIERELGNVDEDISSYKSEHLLPDVQAASSMYMAQSSAANAQFPFDYDQTLVDEH